MRKLFTLLIILLLCAGSSWAQVSTYIFTSSSGTYTEITGGTLLGTATNDDERFVDPASPLGGTTVLTGVGFPIGFNFTYGGVVFDRIAINANGWVSLGQSAQTPSVNINSTSNYSPIGSTVAITPADLVSRIAGLAKDLQGQTGSELRIQTIGTTPNKVCVIQWKGYRSYLATGDNFNFQIQLEETTNLVKIVYGTMTSSTSTTVQVGLRGAPATTASNFNIRTNTTNWTSTTAGATNTATCTLSSTIYPASGLTFSFSIPPPCVSPVNQPTALVLTPNITTIAGSFTAAAGSDSYLVVRSLTNALTDLPVDGTTYAVGGALGGGFVDYFGPLTTFTSTTLATLTQYYYFIFSANSACTGGPKYLTANPLTGTTSTVPPSTYTASAAGGLWSSPATWVGGVVPISGNDIVIPAGSIVTVDQITNYRNLTISGKLNWTSASYTMDVTGDLTINPGGILEAHTPGLAGQTLNLAGNFINNGYANLACPSTLVNFKGSQVTGGSLSQTLGGTGVFLGDGTNGIIRALFFSTTGSSTISTTQPLVTTSFAHTAGALNTNGKLSIDNNAQVFGQPVNRQVADVVVTGMGASYTNAPVVFGASVLPWAANTLLTVNSRYFSGNNVYLCTTAGTTGSVAPTSTASTTFTDGTAVLLYIGPLGTLGNPFIQTTLTVGTQYFYGGNLYVAVATTAPGTTPPTHTSGVVNSFRYMGSPATVSVNFDNATGTVRSLTLVSPGDGYISAAPAVVFSLNGGTAVTAASATAVFIQSIAGTANSLTQKTPIATISGGLNIVSNQAVGGITTTNGGVNYSAAPLVGFSLPTGFLNLVMNNGIGYTTAPTVTVSGGTKLTGGTDPTFTVVVASGKVVSVICTGGGSLWTVPPTLTLTGGGYTTQATAAFPAGCLPTATANIVNGTIRSFTINTPGFGYAAAPTVGLVTAPATVTTAATAPTCRIGLYNLTLNYFSPATSNVPVIAGAEIPTSNRINVLTMGSTFSASTFANITLNGNLELYAASGALVFPASTSVGNLINLNGNTLTYSHPANSGTTSSATLGSVTNGSIVLKSPGGSQTRTFPYYPTFVVVTGTGSLTTGSSISSLALTRTGAPTGAALPSGTSEGARAYNLVTNSGAVFGTLPTVNMNWDATDALYPNDQDKLFIGQSTALTGPWTIRSASSGTGAVPATGSRTTATAAPGPVVLTGNDYFAWVTTSITGPTLVAVPSTVACGYTPVGTYTAEKTYLLSGYLLTGGSGNIEVTAPGNFEVSLTTGTGFGSSVTIPYSGVSLAPTTIYVRCFPTFPATYYTGDITNDGGGATINVPVTGNSDFLAGYCPSIASSTADEEIYSVTMNGNTVTSNCTVAAPGPGSVLMRYSNFYPLGAITSIGQGGIVSFNIRQDECNGAPYYANGCGIWVDFNKNGSFLDPGEEVFKEATTSQGPRNIVGGFTVPITAQTGTTAMRVVVAESKAGDALTPCVAYDWGETEDYLFTITEGQFGNLQGNVIDCYTQYPVDSAIVYIPNSPYSDTTNADGDYQFLTVPAGTYMLVCKKTGYVNDTAMITVEQGAAVTQDFCFNKYQVPPVNLQAVVQNIQTAHVTWLAPGSVIAPDQYIKWDNGTNSSAVGLNPPGGVFYCASRWPVADIAPFGGMYLKKIRFYAFAPASGWVLHVWKGGSQTVTPTLVYSQAVGSVTGSAWNEVTLTTPVQLDATQEFWFGYEVYSNGTDFPAGYDAGPAIDYKGDMISLDGGATYTSIHVLGGASFNGNWNLQGFISSSVSDGPVMQLPIVQNVTENPNQYPVTIANTVNSDPGNPLNTAPEAGSVTPTMYAPLATLTGYNVYRNNVKIANNIPGLFYDDENLEHGTYSYKVSAVYVEGESPKIGPANVTIITCFPPYNVAVPPATITDISAVANWRPSLISGKLNFVVEYGPAGFAHGAGTIVAVNGDSTYTMTGLTAKTAYDFYIRTMCQAGYDSSAWVGPISFTTACGMHILTTTPGERCGMGTVELGATGTPGAIIDWFAAETGGVAIGTGNLFTTPVINVNTNFFVAARESGMASAYVGAPSTAISAVLGSQTSTSSGINFDVLAPSVTIQTIDIYPTAAVGSPITIAVKQGTTTIASWSGVTTVQGTTTTPLVQTLPVELVIPAGTGYTMVASVNPGVIRNDGGVLFPYTIPGVISLTSSTVTGYYYYFYNWMIGSACSSARSTVLATVNPAPPLSVSYDQTVCNNTVATIDVTAGLGVYTSFTWSPATSLFTDMACTIPYVAGTSATTVYVKSATSATTTYTCTATNTDCLNTATSVVTTLPADANLSAVPASICGSGSATLSPTPSTGYGAATFQWQESSDNVNFNDIMNANSITYTTGTLTSTMYYRLIVKLGGSPCFTSASVMVSVNNPVLTGTTPGSRCGAGSVQLAATSTGGGIIKWYTALTGGSPIGTGSPWTTPVITATTSYYVSAEAGTSVNATIGTGTSLTSSTGYPTAFGNYWYQDWSQMVYTAAELQAAGLVGGNITSLKLTIAGLPDASSIANYTLMLGTTTASTLTGFTTTGLTTVYGPTAAVPVLGVNTFVFSTPFFWDGVSNLILDIRGTGAYGSANATTYYTATTGNTVVYGYSYTNNPSFWTSSPTATTSTSRLNVTFTGGDLCAPNPRTEVVATVNTAPSISALATPATICAGQSSSLSASSTNPDYTYTWSPATTPEVGNPVSASPAVTTLYTVTAFDNSNGQYHGCGAIATALVTVNPIPSALTITPSAPIITPGSIQSLVVTGGSMSVNGTIGTGVESNTVSTPYKGWWGGHKAQYLFLPAELSAMGLTPGSYISEISFDITAFASPFTFNDFTIGMANTSITALTSTLETGLTTVLAPSAYVLSGTAPFTNTHILDTPFQWNGTSSLLIETCFNNNNSGGSSSNSANVKSTLTVDNLTAYYTADNTPTVCSAPGIGSTSTVRPNVGFTFTKPSDITWAPPTGLYEDAAATISYTGAPMATVYSKPLVTTTYTATATITSTGCTNTQNVTVTLLSLCDMPEGVSSSAVTATTANISWTAPASPPGSGYEYEIRISGAAGSGAAGLVLDGTTLAGITTAALTGLSGNTLYHAYVRSNCGDNNYSEWTADYTFTTMYENRIVGNVTVGAGQNNCYDAIAVITVGGAGTPFAVAAGGSATFIAGQKISFLQGTTVASNGYMLAKIAPSGPWCNTPPITAAITTGKEEIPFVTDRVAFTLYPNPTNGNFTLVVKGEQTFDALRIEVYSMSGERVMTGNMAGERRHEFNFSTMSSGLYFVKVIADDYVETIKLVKTR